MVRAAHERPATLSPADLSALCAVRGDAALDYIPVLAAFHFVNRIADLLGVREEVPLQGTLRKIESARRVIVALATREMAKMDLRSRSYGASFDETVQRFFPGTAARERLAVLAPRPKLVEVLAIQREERADATALPGDVRGAVAELVEAALPRAAEEAYGFHTRPADPVEAFVFVGTRTPRRGSREMVEALRRAGFADGAILELAIAIAEENAWARVRRLLGLDPSLLESRRTEAGAAQDGLPGVNFSA